MFSFPVAMANGGTDRRSGFQCDSNVVLVAESDVHSLNDENQLRCRLDYMDSGDSLTQRSESTFNLSEADLRLLKTLDAALRNLLKHPNLSPEEIVGIARGIRLIERLPRNTPGTSVEIYLGYSRDSYSASHSISLSAWEIVGNSSASSWVGAGEHESFPSLHYLIDIYGNYEVEGSKREFFASFLADTEGTLGNDEYSVEIADSSTQAPMLPVEEDSAEGSSSTGS